MSCMDPCCVSEPLQEPEPGSKDPSGPREVVFVTDAESATGEQVLLQLILGRWVLMAVLVQLSTAGSAAAAAGVVPLF